MSDPTPTQTLDDGTSVQLVAPAQFIKARVLKANKLTQDALAERLGVSRRTINELVGGKRGISTMMAYRLAAFTASTPEFWLTLQMQYDLASHRTEAAALDITPL